MSCSKLHELCQKNSWGAPNYTTNREGGPDHNPLFSATVTVNGHTFQTAEPCKTSKGARNAAASVALKHFADTVAPLPLPAPLLEAAPGAGSTQLKRSAEDDVSATIAKKLKGVQHLYKSKLQMYAHRKNLSIPTYSCDSDGQQSACRFKCKVKVGEQVFESPGYFSKIKDAENAAAQVAVLSLSSSGIEEDDSGLVKALLQQIARGSGHRLPCYETTKSGEDHMPIFVTSVKIGGETFKGEAASTKRQAEISAARVAYRALADRYSSGNAVLSSSSHKEQDLNHSPSSLKTNESANMEQDVGNEARDETGITFTTTNPIAMLQQVKSLACQYMLPLPQPTMIDKGFGPGKQSTSDAYQSSGGNEIVSSRDEMKLKVSLSPNTNSSTSDAGGSRQLNVSDTNQSSDVNVTSVAGDDKKLKGSVQLGSHQFPILHTAAESKVKGNTSSLYPSHGQCSLSPPSITGLSAAQPSSSDPAVPQTGLTLLSGEPFLIDPRKLEGATVTGLSHGDDRWVAIKLEEGTLLRLNDLKVLLPNTSSS